MTFATGLAVTSQVTVAPSVNVSSVVSEPPEYVTLPTTSKVPVIVAPAADVAIFATLS